MPSGVVGPGVTAPLSVNVLLAFEQPYNQNNPLGQEAFSIFPACLDFPGNNPYFFFWTRMVRKGNYLRKSVMRSVIVLRGWLAQSCALTALAWVLWSSKEMYKGNEVVTFS